MTGVNLGHFAAFFKRSWRSNDILWGRLDGACELVDTLVDAKRLNELRRSGGWNAPTEAELADYLPQLSADNRRALAAALGGMNDDDATAAALPAVKELLIEAAQGEILVEGLPQVIEDAAEEQMLWNEYNRRTIEGPGRDKQGARKTQFIAGAEVLDPAVIAQASAEIAKGAMAAMAEREAGDDAGRPLPGTKYDVGEETPRRHPARRAARTSSLARCWWCATACSRRRGTRADRLTRHPALQGASRLAARAAGGTGGRLAPAPSGRRGVIVGACSTSRSRRLSCSRPGSTSARSVAWGRRCSSACRC